MGRTILKQSFHWMHSLTCFNSFLPSYCLHFGSKKETENYIKPDIYEMQAKKFITIVFTDSVVNWFYFIPYYLQFNGKSTETRNFARKEKMIEMDYEVKNTVNKKIEIICSEIQETHITRGNDDEQRAKDIFFQTNKKLGRIFVWRNEQHYLSWFMTNGVAGTCFILFHFSKQN